MSEELAVQEARPLTAVEVRAQVNLIQEVMKGVMQKGQHYGIVPGCGDKPTLLKPGAEKLMMTFRLAADPQVQEIPTEDGMTVRVVCRITSQSSGVYLGSGLGEASTKEEKYNWRKAVCDGEFNDAPEDRRRLKWIKGYQGNKDCQIKQVRTNPADLANTVLKMAKKRSLVDAILTVTAASDIFTQDIEEMAENGVALVSVDPHRKPIGKPQEKKTDTTENPKDTPSDASLIEGKIENVTVKSGGEGKKAWSKYTVTLIGGDKFSTFDKKVAEAAKHAKEMDMVVSIAYKTTNYGHEIVELIVIGLDSQAREPGPELPALKED